MKDFDELLDRVLREDGLAEPRAGLEGRVMARIRTDEGLPRGSFSQYWSRWRTWLFVPAAACLGIAALIWYGVDGSTSQPDRTASRNSASVLSPSSIEEPRMESSHPLATGDAALSVGGSGRALRDAHLSDDKTVAKMGRPTLEDSPKLKTFPAVSQKGDVAGWLGGSDGGKLVAIAREVTPAAAAAYQQLRAVQSEPIDIAAIEIKPLQ